MNQVIQFREIIDKLKDPQGEKFLVNKTQFFELMQLEWQWYIAEDWLRFISDVRESLIVKPRIKINYIVCQELQPTSIMTEKNESCISPMKTESE